MKGRIFTIVSAALFAVLATGFSSATYAETKAANNCTESKCEGRSTKLYFAFNESLWSNSYNAAELKELIEWVKANDDAVVDIKGWSSKYDEGGMNQYLSECRALTAHIDLKNAGIPVERMTCQGMGVDSSSSNWEARRADIVAYIPETPAPSYADMLEEARYQAMEPTSSDELYATGVEPAVFTATGDEVVANQVLGAKPRFDHGIFSLRTNLLYWVGGLMNLGFEYNIPNTRLGLVVNGGYSPFSKDDWKNSFGGWFVSPELRYYLGKNLNWFVGAQFLTGTADIKLFDTGRDASNITCAGLMGGYKKQLNDNLALDFTLGVGYTSFTFDEYSTANGAREYSAMGLEKKTVLPIQLGVNLIWNIVK